MNSTAPNALHGAATPLRSGPGFEVFRVEHPPLQVIAPHAHDWPCLTIFRWGNYIEQTDRADIAIARPTVAYHPAGRCHGNEVGAEGLETLTVLFDPHLVHATGDESEIWVGGVVGRYGQRLARSMLISSADPAFDLKIFLNAALTELKTLSRPTWLASVDILIQEGVTSTSDLAARLQLHPAWLAREYLRVTGESLQGHVGRRRVEKAIGLVRTTRQPFAAIAAEVGFCDQSHMVRSFRNLLGRTPSMIRKSAPTPL